MKSLIKIISQIGKHIMDYIYASLVTLGSFKTISMNTNSRESLPMPLWKSRTYENVWKSEYFVNKKLSLRVEANLLLNS